ncbi:hypothetical protein QEG23_000258 [Stenotrophomonas maltophilia]|uniref:Uncharacterized protein n=1 Tax=Stenotrophomonas maltophilia TaxID=40324 RepID=A0AAI9FRK9_STEMA|nr:hypothetical protein [Stenotrophomonas maltophilia]
MAVVNKGSAAITARDSAPTLGVSQLASTKVATGRVKESIGVIAVANGDSIGSVLRFFSIHSSWRVGAVLASCTAITTGAADIGLYDLPTRNAGAVVDADFFASAQDLSAALDGSNVLRESGLVTVEKLEWPIWRLLGLPADPGVYYDVAATLTGAATAAGFVALKGHFIDGN